MTVYIAVGTHTRSKIYHTEKDCPYLKRVQDYREVSHDHVNRQNRRVCKLCADAEDNKGKNQGDWHDINRKLRNPEVTYD